jgi:hypothetical protein
MSEVNPAAEMDVSAELKMPMRNEASSRTKKLATTVYITEEQQNLLKELNRRTRVPIAEFIREGIDLVLEKHASMLPGQLGFLNESSQLNQIR